MKRITIKVKRLTSKDGEFVADGVVRVKIEDEIVEFASRDIILSGLDIAPFKVQYVDTLCLVIVSPSGNKREFELPKLPLMKDTKETFVKKLNEFFAVLESAESFVKDATSTKEKFTYKVN
jgi:hypothetical protein